MYEFAAAVGRVCLGVTARVCLAWLAALAPGAWAGDVPSFAGHELIDPGAVSDSDADFDVQLATDGAGVWIAVWQSKGVGFDADSDIRVSRSSDGGATWSPPALLHASFANDSGEDANPRIATDGAGTWLAVWDSDRTLGPADTDLDVWLARSTDAGLTWSPPAALADDAATDAAMDMAPDLASDGAGTWLAVWQASDGISPVQDADIRWARSADGGITWTSPAPLNADAASDTREDTAPRIVTNGAGDWIASWNAADGAEGLEVLSSHSADAGSSWTGPAALNAGGRDDYDARIVPDGAGSWVAIWEASDFSAEAGDVLGPDFDILCARSSDGGATWTAPQHVNRNAPIDRGMDFDPHLATDGQGALIATWQSSDGIGGTGSDFDVMFAVSGDGGVTWTPPTALHPELAADDAGEFDPQVVRTAAGGWLVASYGFGGSGNDSDLRISRGSAPFGPQEVLNGNAAEDTADDAGVALASDGSQNWVAVWSSPEPLEGIGPDQDLLVARSGNGGATWDEPTSLATHAASDVGADLEADVAAGGTGRWVAVWRSSEPLGSLGSDADIFTAFSDDAGGSWSASAPLNDTAATDAVNDVLPRIASDGAGRWVTVWASPGPAAADLDIQVSRSGDGASWSPALPLNSYAASDTSFDHWPDVASDGGGTWVAVWASNLGSDLDVMAARSLDEGATWSLAAAVDPNAANDSGVDLTPRVAGDGAGLWLAVWASNDAAGGLGPDFDLLLSRSTDGGSTWSAPVPLNDDAAADAGDDMQPDLANDGAGNWVVTWSRTGGGDDAALYARSFDGGLTWTPARPLSGSPPGAPGEARIGTDRRGTWLAAWISDEPGGDRDVRFARGSGPDLDGDGLPDGAELNQAGTDPADVDSDLDGLGDGEEVLVFGSNPQSQDSDGDTLGDGAEALVHGTSPVDVDSDDDQLTDDAELLVHGTSPVDADSDNDDLTDGDELLVHGSDPLLADTDGDDLTDGDEVLIHGTDPLAADTDGDGFWDGTELAAGFDPGDAQSPPSSPPNPGEPALMGYWRFQEGTGSLAADEVGNAQGILFGPSWGLGVTGSGLAFDGLDDHVVLAASPALDIQGDAITLAAWVRPADTGAEFGSRVISKRNEAGGEDVYAMYVFEGRAVFRIDDDDLLSLQTLVPDSWVHVAMVYDGADKRIYLNGKLDPAPPEPRTGPIGGSTRPVHLGMREQEERHFAGRIDEVRIYDRALSAEEVDTLFRATGPRVPALPWPGLCALAGLLALAARRARATPAGTAGSAGPGDPGPPGSAAPPSPRSRGG